MKNTAINITKAIVVAASIALLAIFALVGITPVYATDTVTFNSESEALAVPSDFALEADGSAKEVLPVYQGAEAATTTETLPVYQGAEAAKSGVGNHA